MQGYALPWYQVMHNSNEITKWNTFMPTLERHFATSDVRLKIIKTRLNMRRTPVQSSKALLQEKSCLETNF